ncbi:MAG: hypothetical protein EPO20_16060 [Betaproteobacteria bacterium]|nr:MAG: hypothetical protein EPO20_16060 [Betaproteobacteria bacterium]
MAKAAVVAKVHPAEVQPTRTRAVSDALSKSLRADADAGKTARRWTERRSFVEKANAHLADVIREHDPILRLLDQLEGSQGTRRFPQIASLLRRLLQERGIVALKASAQWIDARVGRTRPAMVTNEKKREARADFDELVRETAETWNGVKDAHPDWQSLDVELEVRKRLRKNPRFRNVSLRKLFPAARDQKLIPGYHKAHRAGPKRRNRA